MESSAPPVSYARLASVLFFSVILGFAIGVFFYRQWMYDQRMANDADINLHPPLSSSQSPTTIPSESQPAPSSLTMIKTGPMGPELAGPTSSRPAGTSGQPQQDLAAEIRKNESRVETLAIEYTRKYPVIREYGRDWANYPDLRQYNLDYLQDHDPVRFAYRVSSSKNFTALVKKYAGRPEIIQFIGDVVKTVPSELFKASRDFLSQDTHAADLLKRFTSAIGLPDSLTAGLTSGSASPDQAMSALKTDPKLRELLEQGNVNANELNRGFKNQ